MGLFVRNAIWKSKNTSLLDLFLFVNKFLMRVFYDQILSREYDTFFYGFVLQTLGKLIMFINKSSRVV